MVFTHTHTHTHVNPAQARFQVTISMFHPAPDMHLL